MTALPGAIRRAMGAMSQAELARRCEVTDATVSNWLNGRRTPSYERLVDIASACGVSVSQLVEVHADDLLPVDERPTPIEPVGAVHDEGDAPPPVSVEEMALEQGKSDGEAA